MHSSLLSRSGRLVVSRLPDATLAELGLRRGGVSIGTALLWTGVGAIVVAAVGAIVVYLRSPERIARRAQAQPSEKEDAVAMPPKDTAGADRMVNEGGPVAATPPVTAPVRVPFVARPMKKTEVVAPKPAVGSASSRFSPRSPDSGGNGTPSKR